MILNHDENLNEGLFALCEASVVHCQRRLEIIDY